jgi:outer membrane protein OmpA-like peptidoglycan-associated protein
MAGKTEFKYSATAELIANKKTIESVDISNGKGLLKQIPSDGEIHQVKLTIDARFSSPFGPNDNMFKGHPFGKKFEVAWNVDVDDGKVRILAAEKPKKSNEYLTPKDSCELEVTDKGETVIAKVECLQFNIGTEDTTDSKVFICGLRVAPSGKQEAKAIPKIPNRLLKPEPILYSEDEDYLPPKAIKMLRDWANEVKDIPELLNGISTAMVVIKIEAFASTTGTPKQNKQETDKRLDQVTKVLKEELKGILNIDGKSWGDKKADGKGPKNPRNRRVEIEIDSTTANRFLKIFSGN